MARIDKLREEAALLRSKLLYILGFIMMFIAGIGTLYIKLAESNTKGYFLFGIVVLLIMIKISVIIYFKHKALYENKLKELERE